MTRAISTALSLLAAGAAAVALSVPAYAQEDTEPTPTPTEAPATEATEAPAADAPATDAPATPATDAPATDAPLPPTDDCNASTLAQTVSEVTAALSEYFAAHPDANQALIDITRQPAFVAIGQMDGYFNEHPDQAQEIRTIQAPLAAYKDRCGLEVSPTDALTALADV